MEISEATIGELFIASSKDLMVLCALSVYWTQASRPLKGSHELYGKHSHYLDMSFFR